MLPQYHKKILLEALSGKFDSTALARIIRANLAQDLPAGQIGHPEFHCDDSQFQKTYDYIHSLRDQTLLVVKNGTNIKEAWTCFGRLTHAAQDIYAHSNYIRLWAQQQKDLKKLPESHEILLPDLLDHPDLISGRFYAPWEWVSFTPWIGPIVGKLFPKDSHAYLNNDSPSNSEYFPQAYRAAVLRTVFEYNQIIDILGNQEHVVRFTGMDIH